jgi:hypothetical protein
MRILLVRIVAVIGLVALLAPGTVAAPRTVLVVCAPGYPGSTDEAQPLLDDFARAAARKAGWSEDDLRAFYYQKEPEGLERLAGSDAGLALVPLPFLLQHARTLDLAPRLDAVQITGGEQIWSLVAKKGAISRPADLTGWELAGRPGYAPAFVRGPILGGWGRLPDDTAITFTSNPLSALRRASTGERIAVILDRTQADALDSLPYGAELEIVTRSKPMPGMILATVGKRLDEASTKQLVDALLRLHKEKPADDIMRSIWLDHFEKVDASAIERARTAFEGG